MEDFWRPKKFETGPRRMKENTKERDKKRRIKSLPTLIIQRNVGKKKKSLQNTDTQCKRTFDVKNIYDVYYSRYK